MKLDAKPCILYRSQPPPAATLKAGQRLRLLDRLFVRQRWLDRCERITRSRHAYYRRTEGPRD